jgi:hypothetical protein
MKGLCCFFPPSIRCLPSWQNKKGSTFACFSKLDAIYVQLESATKLLHEAAPKAASYVSIGGARVSAYHTIPVNYWLRGAGGSCRLPVVQHLSVGFRISCLIKRAESAIRQSGWEPHM